MDRNILIIAIVVVLVVVAAIYVQTQGNGLSPRDEGSTTYYVINYKNDTNVSGVGVASKQADGSYRLTDGTSIPETDVERIIDKYVGSESRYCCPSNCPLTYDPVCGVDGNTYVNVCGAALSNVRIAYAGVCGEPADCDQPCIEPKPELRFVCANGQIVRNRVDCQGNESCPYVVSKYFVCADGTQVKDPSECEIPTSTVAALPAGIQTIFQCSDGREVTSEADCSANCVPASTAVTHVSTDFGSGGVVNTIYECWDGTYVKSPKDCPLYCEDPCDCGDEIDPVCADGRTYRNPCLARCDGITSYTEGRCGQPPCAETGDQCTPANSLGSTALTHVSSLAYPSCCEEGSYCSANGVCVPTEQCKPKGKSCSRPNVTYTTAYPTSLQGDCCSGLFCDENEICSEQTSCGTSGAQCGMTSGAAAAPQYLGACCEGYTCKDNTCVIDQCAQEYGDCRSDADCCSGLECSTFGQCKKPCVEAGSQCKSGTECCGELDCVDNVCKKKPAQTTQLCSGAINGPEWFNATSCATGYYQGVWGTYCGFCQGGKLEYRYFCVKNYSYSPTGLPIETLTDQVDLASITCKNGCSGTMCK